MQVIHNFCTKSNCADGSYAHSTLTMDAAGNLFGVAMTGGKAGDGLVFELVPNENKTEWTYKILHDFCLRDCSDGRNPVGTVAVGTAGNIYGVSSQLQTSNAGLAYMLYPVDNGAWRARTIYEFCSGGDCPVGYFPNTGLSFAGMGPGVLYDGMSPLFGTTIGADGTAYEIYPKRRSWHGRLISNFRETGHYGYRPQGGILVDASGTAYGTTWSGGNYVDGVVFESVPTSKGWKYRPLHQFDGDHGAGPRGSLAMDAAGNLYGTTSTGDGSASKGVLYKLVPQNGQSQFSVLYDFCHVGPKCADGADAEDGPMVDGFGNLFGTTAQGGNYDSNYLGSGILYEFEQSTHTFQVVYDFCSEPNCTDGETPESGLIMDSSGDIFGTTTSGGAAGAGVVFELTPAAP